ncbi:hypothetical protein B0O80DRAFT_440800 [Mortierella sp. GBAus27b]|nr:hypothetical protein B0O80DRAFT_440800 [Mortierella sp. GBAus27b]
MIAATQLCCSGALFSTALFPRTLQGQSISWIGSLSCGGKGHSPHPHELKWHAPPLAPNLWHGEDQMDRALSQDRPLSMIYPRTNG